MIRSFGDSDIDSVMSVWLNANTDAHYFIDSKYWKDNLEKVKMMIPQSEVYVYESSGVVIGFIGITDNYIAGIFVDKSARSKGIGSELLSFAKRDREQLELKVYKKNTYAVNFYMNRGFKIKAESIDPQTSETEYIMIWER
ncbi:MAG: GNAT family N-acetyltransferase [Lachnospiraceae bacterium]|nr:GNAT family N-acetyltransferase [Lachnospiraceae bacterium]